MSTEILHQLLSFAPDLLIAALVWHYYRRRKYPTSWRYSTFGPRFWTGTVDYCILWPITFVATILLYLEPPKVVVALLVILESVAWLVYSVFMHARYGQTVGKMVTKVRVVDFRTEGRISYLQAWLRDGIPIVLNLGLVGYQVYAILTGKDDPRAVAKDQVVYYEPSWLAIALPVSWFLAEVLTMLTNEKRRALHDFIAGTVVIRTNTLRNHAEDGNGTDSDLVGPQSMSLS
ncbi:MAG TPA: RDD family protein [Chthoniobacteraceae bacterium]|jgi:uncharacterized RDD family membrane protein YckC